MAKVILQSRSLRAKSAKRQVLDAGSSSSIQDVHDSFVFGIWRGLDDKWIFVTKTFDGLADPRAEFQQVF